jgi:hypothetical protein
VWVACFAVEVRGLLGTGNDEQFEGEEQRELNEEKCCSNEIDQQQLS